MTSQPKNMPHVHLGKCFGHSLMFRQLTNAPLCRQSTGLVFCPGNLFGDKHRQAHNNAMRCGRQSLGFGYSQSCRPASKRGLHVSARGPQPPTQVCYWREPGVVA